MSGLAIQLVSPSISKHLLVPRDVVTHSSMQGQHGTCIHNSLPTPPTSPDTVGMQGFVPAPQGAPALPPSSALPVVCTSQEPRAPYHLLVSFTSFREKITAVCQGAMPKIIVAISKSILHTAHQFNKPWREN